MSNYKLTKTNREIIIRGLQAHCDRRIFHAELDFPLSHGEVELMLVGPEALHHIEYLKSFERFAWDTAANPHICFEHEKVPRTPNIMIYGDPAFYVTSYDAPYSFNLDLLAPEQVDRLVEWSNRMVRELRFKKLVTGVADNFLASHCDTVWHLTTRWPTLAFGFDDNLKSRGSSRPAYPQHYGWNAGPSIEEWHKAHAKQIELIDQVLLEAELLTIRKRRNVDDITGKPAATAKVFHWQSLEGDVV